MGLDTTHDAWHGPYGAFSRWRQALIKAAGYKTEEITAGGMRYTQVVGLNYDIPIKRYMGKGWGKKLPRVHGHEPDAMLLLELHSDCDGKIKRKHLLPLAHRLEELLPAIEVLDDEPQNVTMNARWPPKYFTNKTKQFIVGLREAHRRHESVGFH